MSLKNWPKFKNPHDMSRENIIHAYTQWRKDFDEKLRGFLQPDKATFEVRRFIEKEILGE